MMAEVSMPAALNKNQARAPNTANNGVPNRQEHQQQTQEDHAGLWLDQSGSVCTRRKAKRRVIAPTPAV